MKKYPRLVQCDSRGQIVIPKDVRRELDIEEGTGFFMYTIDDEGILLKKITRKELEDEKIVQTLEQKAGKVGIDRKKIKKMVANYKRTKKGNLELI
ncbi:AbrB/MazE/SpoVT family DNA-binding domain-containing protein [Candidatus Woesearchaeota archaeon]|nr:AbrB/MazE/SpoVT family DNA-binding domain-containing protein [Candidatus Woesearchaeota archaeon]